MSRMVAPSMPPPVSPLRIAVLGAGKIGSTFAFQLVRIGGHDVTVVARPGSERLQELQRDGAIVDVKDERATVRVSSELDEQTPYDLVIVTLLAHQAEAILPDLQRSAARSILFMSNNFHPERFQEAIGTPRCSFGMAFVQATWGADGRLNATIGAAGQKTLIGWQPWVDVFNASGLPAALETDMPLWLRCHVPLCVAFESVSIAGERRGGGASWGQAIVLARGLRACFGLIEGLGFPVYPQTKRRIRTAPTGVVATMLWVLSRVRPFRKVLATGQAECAALVDTMVAAAPFSAKLVGVSDIAAMKPT